MDRGMGGRRPDWHAQLIVGVLVDNLSVDRCQNDERSANTGGDERPELHMQQRETAKYGGSTRT
jgi:hypothetical protein